ncbi:hypothetical protein [Streptomyces sp. SID12501]|uniref:Secreted protein n=1 Tax=Streptomyces sp. SID12501 TaxID=2706042 RepID=A0A6B3BL64_9ACTN|nr:hypothetical protein [Streptomyces sp. SID12501]NEC84769.1 hypothetical protein [Streptomyces sp. SID12501]
MFSNRRLILAGFTVILMAGLGACGSGDGSQDDDPWMADDGATSSQYDDGGGADVQETAPVTPTVHGLRNAVRHVTAKTAKATRPHLVKKCTSATRQVKHTERTGTGTAKRTRTWYTTERYQKCANTRSGTETYTRVVRQERWCVSLDDVDGDTERDAVWYQVTHATYVDAAATDRLDPLEFTPKATGCSW